MRTRKAIIVVASFLALGAQVAVPASADGSPTYDAFTVVLATGQPLTLTKRVGNAGAVPAEVPVGTVRGNGTIPFYQPKAPTRTSGWVEFTTADNATVRIQLLAGTADGKVPPSATCQLPMGYPLACYITFDTSLQIWIQPVDTYRITLRDGPMTIAGWAPGAPPRLGGGTAAQSVAGTFTIGVAQHRTSYVDLAAAGGLSIRIPLHPRATPQCSSKPSLSRVTCVVTGPRTMEVFVERAVRIVSKYSKNFRIVEWDQKTPPRSVVTSEFVPSGTIVSVTMREQVVYYPLSANNTWVTVEDFNHRRVRIPITTTGGRTTLSCEPTDWRWLYDCTSPAEGELSIEWNERDYVKLHLDGHSPLTVVSWNGNFVHARLPSVEWVAGMKLEPLSTIVVATNYYGTSAVTFKTEAGELIQLEWSGGDWYPPHCTRPSTCDWVIDATSARTLMLHY